jgi:SulP family sulfate permease
MKWSSIIHHSRALIRDAWTAANTVSVTGKLEAFPLARMLKGYRMAWFKDDLRGGTDGALLAIPQGMAFAVIAELPLSYGITCSAVACIVGALLMSSRHSIYGPTNASAFMVASFFAAYPNIDRLDAMPMLVFLVGALLVVGAFLRVADLGQYISRSVVVAYLSGAAVQMIVHQTPNVLGICDSSPGVLKSGKLESRTLLGEVKLVVTCMDTVSWTTLGLSVATFITYLGLRRWRPRWPAMALTLIVMGLGAKLLQTGGFPVVTYADAQFTWRDLLPMFPDFASLQMAGRFSQMFGLALALAFLAMLENSSMARTLASRSGHDVDANQDMLSLGTANLACAYFSGMPCSHSLTRSMANFQSGAKTPISAIVGGLLCLIGALTIGPLVAYVPKASLGVLVMCAAAGLLNSTHLRIALRATGSDAIVFLTTFIASLMVPLHVAIFLGVGVSIVLYLRKAARPTLVEYAFNQEGNLAAAGHDGRQNPSISIVHVEGELFFGAAELFRTQIQRTCADPNLRIIILRLKNARHLDATSVMALDELVRVMRASGRDLIVSGASAEVIRVLQDSGVNVSIGDENIFPGDPSNPNLATRRALKRAQQSLGTIEADIHIYYDPSKEPKKDA